MGSRSTFRVRAKGKGDGLGLGSMGTGSTRGCGASCTTSGEREVWLESETSTYSVPGEAVGPTSSPAPAWPWVLTCSVVKETSTAA